jgi:thiamine kinase-like enzyme
MIYFFNHFEQIFVWNVFLQKININQKFNKMKKLIFFMSLLLTASIVFGQKAKEEMITFNKIPRSGVSIIISDNDPKTVQAALRERMETDAGLKGSNSGGFRFYQNQQFPTFGLLNYDIYTQVTETGSRKNKRTVVYLLVSKGNQNFVTPATDPELVNNMKKFLNDFTGYLEKYNVDEQIRAKAKTIEKLEKQNNKLVSKRDKMKKQLDAQESQVTKNQTELTNLKSALEGLKNSK